MTCSSSCALRASCSVDWNAATSSCGSSRMKPDRVGDHDVRAARQRQLAHRGVERREQLVGDVGLGAGERAEQRRLAGVGVADQRHARHRDRPRGRCVRSRAAGEGARACPVSDRTRRGQQSAVGLELRLAGTAQADAALLPFEVRPAAHQARRQVLELRELDLELALEAAGALREDVEDQAAAVEHAPAGQLLEIALLAGRQRVVDEDEVGAVRPRRLRRSLPPCRCRRSTVDRAARADRSPWPPALRPRPWPAAGTRRDLRCAERRT